jgi:hypothetical protein
MVYLCMVRLWSLVWSIHGYKTKEFPWTFLEIYEGGACKPFGAK